MFRQIKLFGVLVAVIVLSLCTSTEAATNWNTNVIQAMGIGVPPTWAVSQAQATALARTAALADARRNLLAEIKGTQVDAETTVENHMVKNDLIVTKIDGIIKGARVVSEGPIEGGGYQVTLEMPMFGGPESLAGTVLNRPTTVEPIPTPEPDYRPPTDYDPPALPDYKPTRSSGSYTGLIIDCRGLGKINRVMSPAIRRANGKAVYGHKILDYDRVIREGTVAYTTSMSKASRAGSNPLVVRAIKLEEFNATPIVSPEDAEMILYENEKTHFLDDLKVVFYY